MVIRERARIYNERKSGVVEVYSVANIPLVFLDHCFPNAEEKCISKKCDIDENMVNTFVNF